MILRTSSIAWSGFLQLVRSRVYWNIVVAGIGLMAAALAFEELTAGAGGRVLLDVGLAFIALVVAALAGVVSITALARELETKQIHLVLARPISRGEVVAGRFLTIALLVVVSNFVLGTTLAGLLLATEAPHAGLALGAALFSSFEGFIVAAVAMFFGVGSSSTMSAMFTVILFILGRLTGELLALIERGIFGEATLVLRGIYAVLPHLTAFDLTPLAHGVVPPASLLQTAAYGFAYTFVFVGAAALRFARRDLL